MSEPLLEKISEALNKNGLDYIVIGGQAVLIYGYSRFTNDIDILVGVDFTKLKFIDDICNEIGLTRLKDDEFTRKTNVIPLFDPKSNFRADLIFSYTDFEKEAISRAVTALKNGVSVRYATIEDLILMKLYASRAIDIEDIKKLVLLNKNIDTDYIFKWLSRFDEDPELKLTEKFRGILK
ncbi:MAG: hypothetical protein UZ05_CHB002000320 [Chlorobi bacterium OLB5]|nr:MAG: hypothetical protein UZ05_CHB002000320 [Chlorobi bacterium OLB5]